MGFSRESVKDASELHLSQLHCLLDFFKYHSLNTELPHILFKYLVKLMGHKKNSRRFEAFKILLNWIPDLYKAYPKLKSEVSWTI